MLRADMLEDPPGAATLGLFLGAGPIVTARLPATHADALDPARHPPGGIGSILLLAGAGETRPARLRPLLADCHRSLPRGGRIVVMVENRLRRIVARLRAPLRGTVPAGPSLRAVVRALQDAGFADVAVFSVAPSAAEPREIQPLAPRGAWLAPGYLVTAAVAGSAGMSAIKEIVRSVEASLPATDAGERRLLRVAASAKEKSIAFLGASEAQIVVRIPHSAAAQEVEAGAHGMLEHLQRNPGIAGRVPRPILSGTAGGQLFFAESCIAGMPLAAALWPSNRATWVREADAFLRALNPQFAATPAMPLEDGLSATIIQPMLDRVLGCVGDEALRARARNLFESSLRGAASRAGIVHGDFGISNIFVADGKIRGVVDWENALRAAPPVLDAFNYLDSVQRRCGRNMTLAETVPMLAAGDWPVPEEFEFLREFFRFCGIDFRFRRGFALLYFLRHVGPQLSFADGDEALRARVHAVLRRMLD